MATRVLLVDDDPAVLSGLRRAFALEGYEVITAENGETAIWLAQAEAPDLIVLDVVLPRLDGFSALKGIRRFSRAPVLMLTARDTVPDRVAGLDYGADDYLVKPFALDELMARCRALLRRNREGDSNHLCYAGVEADLLTREAFCQGKLVALSPLLFELMVTFLRHPRQVLTREQLSQRVWGHPFERESNFVDVAVMELRKKLEAHGPNVIRTIRGVGYALRGD